MKSLSGVDKRTPASLQMTYILTKASEKIPALLQLIMKIEPTPTKTIIYLSTCAAVDYWQDLLNAVLPSTFALVPLHGKHPPNVRQKNFTKFVTAVTPTILLTTDVAARGLDIPQVDLVVQIDPPSDAKVFMHRCGRAGRAGRKGLSVIFLQPGREEDYIPFLEIRKTPITLLLKPEIRMSEKEAKACTDKMREIVLADRALFDNGQRAFVSWVRAYSKHQASSIFRVDDLDWEDLGHAWALIKMPKMPELKKWNGDKSLGVKVKMSEYAYKDKTREKARLEAMKEAAAAEPFVVTEEMKLKRKKREAWSAKHDAQDLKEERRERKRRKKEAERWESLTEEERKKELELQALLEEVRQKTKEEEERRRAADKEEFKGFD